MTNLSGVETAARLSQQTIEDYIEAWVAREIERVAFRRGKSDPRSLARSQAKLMCATLEVAKDCTDADHYLACKQSLDRQAYMLLRIEESYSFASFLSAPEEIAYR